MLASFKYKGMLGQMDYKDYVIQVQLVYFYEKFCWQSNYENKPLVFDVKYIKFHEV